MSVLAKELAPLFRPMREQDLPEIIAIEKSSYLAPWSGDSFADCLRIGYCCWVLQVDARVGGYGIMTAYLNEAHVLNLCIREDLRCQGHGRALLTHLLELARDHNARDAYLEVRPSNSPALRLYEDMGFRTIGVRRGYYPSETGREDALVLTSKLG